MSIEVDFLDQMIHLKVNLEEPIQIDIYVECQLGGICSLALLWVNFLSNLDSKYDVRLNFTPSVWD
jgi:hypothetical protein